MLRPEQTSTCYTNSNPFPPVDPGDRFRGFHNQRGHGNAHAINRPESLNLEYETGQQEPPTDEHHAPDHQARQCAYPLQWLMCPQRGRGSATRSPRCPEESQPALVVKRSPGLPGGRCAYSKPALDTIHSSHDHGIQETSHQYLDAPAS